MILDIPENQIENLSGLILDQTGLFFPPNKWDALKKGIRFAAAEYGIDALSFVRRLLEPPPVKEMLDSLVGYLTIGETYFLRDKNLFQILQDNIIREIIEQKQTSEKKINILCAGCATGEEPYSIAILIDHVFPQLKKWKITITGTDINTNFLEKAGKGIYTRWSLRETPQPILKKYFIPIDANYFKLVPHIQSAVRFTHLNLMQNDYIKALHLREEMDVVLCRNVIMYFDDQCRNQVIEKLTGLILKNGWFITSPAESGFVRADGLTPVKFSNIILHQKKEPLPCKNSDRRVYPDPVVCHPKFHFPKRISLHQPVSFRIKKNTADHQPGRTDADIYQEAVKYYENGKYKESIRKLSKILTKNTILGGNFLMGAEVMTLLAKSHANMGELDEANYWCKKAIGLEKLRPEIYFLQSTIFQDAGNIKASVRSLRQALYLDPEFVMAHFMLGLLLLQENNTPEGNKSMTNALSLLQAKEPDEVLPFSEGITAARLIETIKGMLANKARV